MKWLLWGLVVAAIVVALLSYDPVGKLLGSDKDCRLLVVIVLAITACLFSLGEWGDKSGPTNLPKKEDGLTKEKP